MILETGALGKYADTLFPPLGNKGQFGIILHTLYLGGGLKFLTATGKQTLPALTNAIVMNHPDHFLLVPCPKRYMREVNFVPHIVFDIESPLPADHPILKAPNTVLVPHIGFETFEAMSANGDIAMRDLEDFLSGHNPAS